MEDYQELGNPDFRDAYLAAECRLLRGAFDRRGKYCGPGSTWPSRERLYACLALYGQDSPENTRLADAIALATPADNHGFAPVVAAEILLRHRPVMSSGAALHLEHLLREHLPDVIERCLASTGIRNFPCMLTWTLLAASRLLDYFDFPGTMGRPPTVYNRHRLRAMGLNGLRNLHYHVDDNHMAAEWNCPTYTPVCLHTMAKIADFFADDEELRVLALDVEHKLWHEVLECYHPGLNHFCGPYDRAYRSDLVGHLTNMRVVLAYTGLSRDAGVAAIEEQLGSHDPRPHDGQLAQRWARFAWFTTGRYHVPRQLVDELRQREYPRTRRDIIRWASFGYIDPERQRYWSVQGELMPAGEAEVIQRQYANHAIGWRTMTRYGTSFPLHFHYARRDPVRDLRDVRSITGAVLLNGAPTEWETDYRGQHVEPKVLTHNGRTVVKGRGRRLLFVSQPNSEFSPIPTDELSFNFFVPLHFGGVDEAMLDDTPWTGEPVSIDASRAACRIADAGFTCHIEVHFDRKVEIRLWRWSNFLRLAGFWHRGETKQFSSRSLSSCKVTGSFRVSDTRDAP